MRGYKKSVVFLKNTGSSIFEEAYFVLKDKGHTTHGAASADMVKEASRIIEESFCKKKGPVRRILLYIALFFAGVLTSFIITLILR